jgi:hypothetical protein
MGLKMGLKMGNLGHKKSLLNEKQALMVGY